MCIRDRSLPHIFSRSEVRPTEKPTTPDNMYHASSVYLRRQTFKGIFFGGTEYSTRRFLQPEKRLRHERCYKYKTNICSKQILIEALCRISVRTSLIWRPSSYSTHNPTLRQNYIYKAKHEIRPSRWVSKLWNRFFKQLLRSYPGRFILCFCLIFEFEKCMFFFEQKP